VAGLGPAINVFGEEEVGAVAAHFWHPPQCRQTRVRHSGGAGAPGRHGAKFPVVSRL